MELKLYKEHPWRLFHEADKELADLWDFPFSKKKEFPSCDFHEDEDHYFISMDIPGVKKKDLKISLKDNVLNIFGIREEIYKEKDKHTQSRFTERFYGSFHRVFTLPSSVNEEKIEAQFTNGVLELLIPKSTAVAGREIAIQEGDGKKEGLFSHLLKGKKATQ